MPYVQVPKDLTQVKTKVALNLTKRQLAGFGIAAAAAIPTFILTKDSIGVSNAMLLLVAIAFPPIFLALYEKDGQPIEKIVRNFWIWSRRPKRRLYRTYNIYSLSE